MGQYPRAEAAKRAGVEPNYVNRLIELAIITPDGDDRLSHGDVRRAQMARTLETVGIPLDRLGAAIQGGHISLAFMDTPTYERFAALSDVTFAELSEKTAIPVELLMIIREAVGSAQPQSTDYVREDELGIVPFIQIQVDNGFRPVAIEPLRVTGDSMRRIAE